MFSTSKEERMHNAPDQNAGEKGYYPGLTEPFSEFSVEAFFGHVYCFVLPKNFGFYLLQKVYSE